MASSTYDVFLCHSADPDHKTAIRVDSFLTAFHSIVKVDKTSLPITRVFRDAGSLKRRDLERQLEEAVKKSRFLLVFCSTRSPGHSWMAKEISWFLEVHDPSSILLVYTESFKSSPAELVPPKLVPLIQADIVYDLRGIGREKNMDARNAEEQMVAIAAAVSSHHPTQPTVSYSANDLLPVWYREKVKRTRRNLLFLAAVILVIAALSGFGLWQRGQTNVQAERAATHLALRLGYAAMTADARPEGSQRALLLATESLSRKFSIEAYRVARRELSLLPKIRHTFQVDSCESLFFTEDERYLVVVGTNIRLWKLGTGTEVALELPSSKVVKACSGHDASRFAVAYNSGIVLVDPQSKSIRQVPKSAGALALAIDALGKRIAYVAEDGVQVRELSRLDIQGIHLSAPDPQWCEISFNWDGTQILVGTREGESVFDSSTGDRVWGPGKGDFYSEFAKGLLGDRVLLSVGDGRTKEVLLDAPEMGPLPLLDYETPLLRVNDDGQVLAYVRGQNPNSARLPAYKGATVVWSRQGPRNLQCQLPGSEHTLGLDLSRTGETLATYEWDGVSRELCRVWKANGTELARFIYDGPRSWYESGGPQPVMGAMDLSPSGEQMAVFSGGKVWVLDAFGRSARFALPPGGHVSPDGKYAATAAKKRVFIRDLTQPVAPRVLIPNLGLRSEFREWALNSKFAVFGTNNGELRGWNLATQEMIFDRSVDESTATVDCLLFRPGKHEILAANRTEAVRIFDVQSNRELYKLSHNDVSTASFGPQGDMLLTGSEDGSVVRWTFEKGAWKKNSTRKFGGRIETVLFSPDGRCSAAAANIRGETGVWDSHSGKELLQYSDPGFVNGIAFSPDSTLFAIATGRWDGEGKDGKVALWHIATKKLVYKFSVPYAVTSIGFSHKGQYLATNGTDHRTRVYSVDGLKQIGELPGLSHGPICFGSQDRMLWGLEGLDFWNWSDISEEVVQRTNRPLAQTELEKVLGEPSGK